MDDSKRFLSIDDIFKDAVKKIVPILADSDEFEAKYLHGLSCLGCGEETASGLFYRKFNQKEWLLANKSMKCSICLDREAFKVYQNKSLKELKSSVGERLTKEYFLPPEALKGAGFNNYQETNTITAGAKERAVIFTKLFLESTEDYYNLLIMGNPGTGKTHLCTAIARNIKKKGFTVGFLTTGKLLSMIKETYQKGAAKTEVGIFRDLTRLDLLILDDVGSEAKGGSDDWRKAMIFEVVESRSGKPTIYTSNLTDTDLPFAVGERVFSRFYNNTKFIDLFTDDFRKRFQIN
ncbi:ATP-binding protein [Peribacillus psychrosaccharolyticus]|nr:ATP-binding protein [Peribacillus psychrosaccharolyticus]MEC2057985.1 ATP-binding protein [Peribacillus psychrosaccharolyticus]MED3745861.1 ATP-binding protein [Peribacillus psychrosaccharolyticus]